MTTVADIVTRAFRKLGVASEGEPLEADTLARGVDAFNDMLHAWKLRSVDISHTDMDASDTFPLSAEYREGCVYVLASRLSPDYTVPQAFDAEQWFRRIQAAYHTITPVTFDGTLLKMPSGDRWRFDDE